MDTSNQRYKLIALTLSNNFKSAIRHEITDIPQEMTCRFVENFREQLEQSRLADVILKKL